VPLVIDGLSQAFSGEMEAVYGILKCRSKSRTLGYKYTKMKRERESRQLLDETGIRCVEESPSSQEEVERLHYSSR